MLLKILKQLQQQLNDSAEVIIIYNNPVCHELFEQFEFVKIKDYPDMWGNGINVYSNKPKKSRLLSAEIKQTETT